MECYKIITLPYSLQCMTWILVSRTSVNGIVTNGTFILIESICVFEYGTFFSEVMKTQHQAYCRITTLIHLGELITVL